MWEDGYLRFLIILGMMRDMLHLRHGRSLIPYAQMVYPELASSIQGRGTKLPALGVKYLLLNGRPMMYQWINIKGMHPPQSGGDRCRNSSLIIRDNDALNHPPEDSIIFFNIYYIVKDHALRDFYSIQFQYLHKCRLHALCALSVKCTLFITFAL